MEIMPRTPDAHEALEWIESRLAGGATVTLEQPGVGLPVEWTAQRWAEFTDDMHIPAFRTRDGRLLVCITTSGLDGFPEYVTVNTEDVVIYAAEDR